jgi:carboxyl-terminal processing protease
MDFIEQLGVGFMSREVKIILISLSIGLALGLSFQAGYYIGNNNDNKTSIDNKISIDDPYLASVEESWNNIIENYVENNSIDYELLSQYAIQGMLDYLDDPHSAYLDPETYQMDADDTSGSYFGIGALISIIDGQLVMARVYENTPAAQAGLLSGDVVLEIDGVTTEGMTTTEAVLRVRGDAGTPVTLQVLHPDAVEPMEVTVVRAEINSPSVDYEMMGTVAYIQIDQFTEDTDEEFNSVLEAVTDAGATGIVLDLRSNPGGLLDTVVHITSCFYSDGDILTVRYNDGTTKKYTAQQQNITTDLPLIILVNENSASGSEVLAGALQDNDRALIEGKTTYGKGSVNWMVKLPDGAGLYITIARWLTPDGNLIEGIGIIPDVETGLTGDEEVQWAVDYLNDSVH